MDGGHEVAGGHCVILGIRKPAIARHLGELGIGTVEGEVEAGLHEHGVGKAVRHVEERTDRPAHAVDDRDRRVVERDARLGRRDGHLRASLDVARIAHASSEVGEDPLGGGKGERARERLCLARGERLDGMAQRVDARGGRDARRGRHRELRVDDGELGDERSAGD